jgi:hypothetical protein
MTASLVRACSIPCKCVSRQKADERFEMQFLLQLLLLQLQFALEGGHKLRGVLRSTSETVISTGRLSRITTIRLAMVTSQSVKA